MNEIQRNQLESAIIRLEQLKEENPIKWDSYLGELGDLEEVNVLNDGWIQNSTDLTSRISNWLLANLGKVKQKEWDDSFGQNFPGGSIRASVEHELDLIDSEIEWLNELIGIKKA